MKFWQCPKCGRQWFYQPAKNILMRICRACQIEASVVGDENEEIKKEKELEKQSHVPDNTATVQGESYE